MPGNENKKNTPILKTKCNGLYKNRVQRFGYMHYTFINQIFGDKTVREIIMDLYPRRYLYLDVEPASSDFERGVDSIHHIVIDTKNNKTICSVDDKYQNVYIHKHDTLCQSYTLLVYFAKKFTKGLSSKSQKERQMIMITLYRKILNDPIFIAELKTLDTSIWRDYTKYNGNERHEMIYIRDNTPLLVKRIKTTLDAWELYGYKYFIGDGDGNILI